MQELGQGERQKRRRRRNAVPVKMQEGAEERNDDRSEHHPEKQHGADRTRGEDLLVGDGRTVHGALRAFHAERENGQGIGDQIDPEQLRGREEVIPPKKERDDEHREHLGKVGGQEKGDRLFDVEKDVAPLLHRAHHGGKIVVGEHYVGGVFGDVRPRAHRHAHVGGFERRRIVDTVPRHGDDLARALQGAHDLLFMAGGDPRIHGILCGAAGELLFPHGVEFLARHDLRKMFGDAEPRSDGERRFGCVPRDHHRSDARAAAGGDRLFHALLGRVEHGRKPHEHKPFFPLGVPAGKSEHAHGAPGIGRHARADLCAVGLRDGALPRVGQDPRTFCKQHVGAALDVQPAPLLRACKDAHHLPLGRKGNAAQLFKVTGKADAVGILHERDLRRIPHVCARAALDRVADAHTPQQLPFGHGARIALFRGHGFGKIGADRLHRHSVFGEGARLVRTDHAAPAQTFHRAETAHDGARGGHALHAERQDHGDDRAHALRNGGDGHGDRAHHALQKAHPSGDQRTRKQHERHAEHRDGDHLSELCDRLVEGRGSRLALVQKAGDLAHFGVHTAGGDDAPRPALDAERAEMRRIRAHGECGTRDDAVVFFGGSALSRQRRFVAAKIFRMQNAAVRGDPVALFQLDDVAHHERFGVQLYHLAVAYGFRLARGELFEFFDGRVRAVLLQKADNGIQKNDK